ncbi:MAG: precorrin-3B C(17)-methyltransferase [Geminicoccaceae bacterium]|nr:precorrin-3B C(17)-methyltransferase [Geminicoccaceae bacterium]
MAELRPAVLALTRGGAQTARMLGHELHGLAGRVEAADVTFDDMMAHCSALFAAGRPIVGLCAAGILIRAVAPLLASKHDEPPVIAVSEDGSHVVPLLGGHRGANRMARDIARQLGGTAAVTTAGDTVFGIALDEPPEGWALANPQDAKSAAASMLRDGGAVLKGEQPPWSDIPRAGHVTLEGTLERREGGPMHLVYHPKRVAIGVGCARDCPPDELFSLVEQTLTEANLASASIAVVATVDLKADEPAVLALARRLGLPLRLFTAEELETFTPRLANPSGVVFAEIGCHGVAEAAALATTGPTARLKVDKRKTARATCALAIGDAPILHPAGRKPGSVRLVGIGPGQAAWRTPEASRLVAGSDELVGYGLYLDLLGPLARGKPQHRFPLGEETERCRFALERAGEGFDVALVCSGDAGIYAMGALVHELLDRAPSSLSDAARRVEVISAPGISALQGAAARAGAPLGHDFCAISLSDLMTPWPTIEHRIEAAATGDFVIAFYNPVSMRRRTQLARARDILLQHRPADTPVMLASHIGRTDETIRYRRLHQLQVDEIDMLTTVLVGSSQSRLYRRGTGPVFYTPRGYGDRRPGTPPTGSPT